ncbi:MAG: hypothetical protein F2602_05475, partial [Actinobacteria bacterium]|nr:hypothetical protein [Actinomycetota bacterium]
MFFKVFLLIALFLGQMYPSAAAVKIGDKCSKVGLTVKSKSTSLLCAKSGNVNRWTEIKNPKSKPSSSPSISEQLL